MTLGEAQTLAYGKILGALDHFLAQASEIPTPLAARELSDDIEEALETLTDQTVKIMGAHVSRVGELSDALRRAESLWPPAGPPDSSAKAHHLRVVK